MKTDIIYMVQGKKTEIKQTEIGPPRPWEVQVEVVACGICTWDTYLFKGINLLTPFPFTLGHEAAGVIREVGEMVNNLTPGDCVFCIDERPQTQMAQLLNITAAKVGIIPGKPKNTADFISYIGEPCVCVVSGMSNIRLAPGDNVVIIGTGYMGLLNVQAFHHSYIGSLTCFDIDERRLGLAKKYGAGECYISGSGDAIKATQDIITYGGADIVIECSGTQDGLQLAMDLVRKGGTISNFAWHRENRTIDASIWHKKGLRIINTSPSCDLHFSDHVIPTQRLMARRIFDQTDLITHVMDYQKIQELLTIAESKSDGYIKGVVTFR